MEGELKKIKKIYGEDFAKLCRSLFSTILEEEGKLLDILTKNFAPSRLLYKDIINNEKVYQFKGFVFNQAGIIRPARVDVDKTPEELLASVGYKLYRCKTDREVKSFRKYYAKGESLCTFRDPDRIREYDIFFVVREDVDTIRREDFKKPKREDRYGTSVMSFQFDKVNGELSIKNRYNHIVRNPDSTYGNDLEAIVMGLTDSFAKYYGIDSRVDYRRYRTFDLPGYVRDKYGALHKYNTHIHSKGMYFCENNVVIKPDGTPVQYDKAQYELINTFLIDKSAKTITDLSGDRDSFTKLFVDVEKIDVEKGSKDTRDIIVTNKNGTYFKVTVDETNAIIHYENEFQTEVPDNFLQSNLTLKTISIPKVKTIGHNFLNANYCMTEIDIPEVEKIGSGFLRDSIHIHKVNLPKLKKVGDYFLYSARELTSASFPELEIAGDKFITFSAGLESFEAPKLKVVGDIALAEAVNLTNIDLPCLEQVGGSFLLKNNQIKEISFPKLENIGGSFMSGNTDAVSVDLPSAIIIGSAFMFGNTKLSKINMPKVKKIGAESLFFNRSLRKLDLPSVEIIEADFLSQNRHLKVLNAPRLKRLGEGAFLRNTGLRVLNFPSLEYIDGSNFEGNKRVRVLDIPMLEEAGEGFLTATGKLRKIRVSNTAYLPKHLKAHTIEEVGRPEQGV